MNEEEKEKRVVEVERVEYGALLDDRMRLAMWTSDGLPKGWDVGHSDDANNYCSCCPNIQNGSAMRYYGEFVNPAEPLEHAPTYRRARAKRALRGHVDPSGAWNLQHNMGYTWTIIAGGSCPLREAFATCDAQAAAYIARLDTD